MVEAAGTSAGGRLVAVEGEGLRFGQEPSSFARDANNHARTALLAGAIRFRDGLDVGEAVRAVHLADSLKRYCVLRLLQPQAQQGVPWSAYFQRIVDGFAT